MHKQVNPQLSKTDSKQKWKLQVSFKVGYCPAPLHRRTILYDTTVIYDIYYAIMPSHCTCTVLSSFRF